MAAKKQKLSAPPVNATEVKGLYQINPPKMQTIEVPIRGTSKYVMNRFAGEVQEMLREEQARGQVDKPRGRGKKHAPKDFEAGYRGSMHVSTEGWYGIPVTALRAAMVRAALLAGVEMTMAKMCVFVIADGYTKDGDGLVKLKKGKPEMFIAAVINKGGSPDQRARAQVPAGWEATVKMQYDADFMSHTSAVNLLHRAGINVGVGAGRPFSKMSAGQGWGTFEIKPDFIVERTDAAAE